MKHNKIFKKKGETKGVLGCCCRRWHHRTVSAFVAPRVTRYARAEKGVRRFTRCKYRAVGQPVNRTINSATGELCRACPSSSVTL